MNTKANIKTIVKKSLHSNTEIHVGENESIQFIFFADTTRNVDCNLTFYLSGSNASISILGFVIGVKYSAELSLRVVHQARNTRGFSRVTSVLGGDAENRVRAMINIEKGGSEANAYFGHNSLLISPKAFVDTSPALEIQTNDVKAVHQATIGHMDAEVLFYLKSRGIELSEAKKLVLVGFTHQHVHEIIDVKVRQDVSRYLTKHLEQLA